MKNDYISRQAAIDGKISIQCANGVEIYTDNAVPVEHLKNVPTADVIPVAEIYDAGYKGKEVQFRIGGRLFAIRELAQ